MDSSSDELKTCSDVMSEERILDGNMKIAPKKNRDEEDENKE
jgi:hypothetical protein